MVVQFGTQWILIKMLSALFVLQVVHFSSAETLSRYILLYTYKSGVILYDENRRIFIRIDDQKLFWSLNSENINDIT